MSSLSPADFRAMALAPRQTILSIVGDVCRRSGHNPFHVMGKSREADICRVRELVCYKAYREAGMSYPQIGRVLRRHHTTILHAVRNEAKRRGEVQT